MNTNNQQTDPGVRRPPSRQQSLGEEIANSVTHGIGAALSLAALVLLVVFAGKTGDAWRIVSLSIYGAALFFLYLISTLYHSFTSPRTKQLFRLLDHSSIFLLIAGTYTPVTLISMRGPWGWTIFALIWALAIAALSARFSCSTNSGWSRHALYRHGLVDRHRG
jgi:hemolysin III